jgi:hypothetical protein
MDHNPDPDASGSISIATYRKLLGIAAQGLSDDDVAHIRDVECQLADAIIEYWLRKRNSDALRRPPTQPS